jgi:hypothetical protein
VGAIGTGRALILCELPAEGALLAVDRRLFDRERMAVRVLALHQLGDSQRRDRLVAIEEASGTSRDDPVPFPSAAACSLNRAMATTRSSTSRVIVSSVIRIDMAGLPLTGRSGSPGPNH